MPAIVRSGALRTPVGAASAAVGRRAILSWLRRISRSHRKEVADRFGRNRAAEQPALRLGAAEVGQGTAELRGSDAFGGNRTLEIVAETGDRADDRRGPFAFDDGRDEALVDLDPVERQPIDLSKACVARAEVVERNA